LHGKWIWVSRRGYETTKRWEHGIRNKPRARPRRTRISLRCRTTVLPFRRLRNPVFATPGSINGPLKTFDIKHIFQAFQFRALYSLSKQETKQVQRRSVCFRRFICPTWYEQVRRILDVLSLADSSSNTPGPAHYIVGSSFAGRLDRCNHARNDPSPTTFRILKPGIYRWAKSATGMDHAVGSTPITESHIVRRRIEGYGSWIRRLRWRG
jgi:hypothetical protein